jgi:hypothetical protein
VTALLEAGIEYIHRGWPILPVGTHKRPLIPGGFHNASMDEAIILEWSQRFPNALWAVATGEGSGVVALDVDVRETGSGNDTLEELGVPFHPTTPTAHTPSGGYHCLFQWPDFKVASSAGKVGPFLDVRGDDGYLIVPPGAGRKWDEHLGLDTPLAEMPEWMMVAEAKEAKPAPPPRPTRDLNPYGKAALERAANAIVKAFNGQQRETLNREAFGIGQLVGGSILPATLALNTLSWAARQMPSYDSRRPWRSHDLNHAINDAFNAGLRQPREART